MSHTCHAKRCDVEVPPRLFMCKTHWGLIPKKMQAELWDSYVPGQEVRKDPTRKYLQVARSLINYVDTL